MSEAPSHEEQRINWPAWLGLACVVLLGLALRFYRLAEEPAWYDEVITMAGVDAPTLGEFFSFWRFTNWNAVPVYYTLQYFWAQVAGDSVVGFRILSIIPGMLAVPLLYRFGRELFGPVAGLTAALCLAMSSVHIYQSQEVRNYSWTMFAALLCGYTFYKLLDNGRARWWVLNALANLFLVWTHLFGCFLLVACGLTLAAFSPWRFKRSAGWGTLNFALMLPSVLWIRTFEPIQYYQPPTPALWMLVNNIFTDVWSATLGTFIFREYTWQVPVTAWTNFFGDTYHRADTITFAVLLVATAFGAGAALWQARKPAEGEPDRPRAAAPIVFLVLWLVLPGLILWVLAQTWRTDIFSPKYTTYCSIAGYLLVGGAVHHLRWRPIQATAFVLVALLFAHRVGVTVTHPQRPDWYAAAEVISADATAEDRVVLYPNWQKITLDYNLRPLKLKTAAVDDLGAFCLETESALEAGNSVWATWSGGYGSRDFPERFEHYINLRDFPYTRHAYWSGMKCIFVFRVHPGGEYHAISPERQAKLIEEATRGYAQQNDGTGSGLPVDH